MTRKTIHALIAIIVGLALMLVVLRSGDIDDIAIVGQPLLPDFKGVANEVTEVRVARAAGEDGITIRRDNDGWIVPARDGYAADVGKLRKLIIALADAEILEEKTSNAEQYEKLGVDDPEDGGKGTKIVLSGPDISYSVVLGNTAQGNKRYARLSDDATSYLVDQEIDLPATTGDWLLPDIIDIKANDVRRVSIAHADGETIVIEKNEKEQTDFDVIGIPEGRELSYATVGNGIAGALADLTLDDVRAREEAPPSTTTTIETWDGLKVAAEIVSLDETTWIAFAVEPGSEESAAGGDTAELNERLTGWQYQVADYKKNLLARRWDDILKSADD